MGRDTSVRFLVVSSDPALEDEFESALRSIKGFRCVATYARDERSGIEEARLHLPDVVVIELRGRLEDVRAFAEEIGMCAPEAAVVAVYRRQMFDDADSEMNAILQVLRARVQDFLRRPISAGELQQTVDRLFRQPHRHSGPVGRVVSFISNKGGVGKSTVSTNVACELATRHPGRVLLIDASLQLGICASSLDLEPAQTVTDAAQQLDRLDTTLLEQLTIQHESGLRVLAAPPTMLAAADVDERVISRVIALARRSYEYVVIDTFPALDSVLMSILDLSNIVCVVTQVVVPVLNGTASLLETLRELGLDEDRVWVLLNRGQPRFAAQLRPADIEEHLGIALRHQIGYDKRVPSAVNLGRPLVLSASRLSAFRRAIAGIADDIVAHAPEAPGEPIAQLDEADPASVEAAGAPPLNGREVVQRAPAPPRRGAHTMSAQDVRNRVASLRQRFDTSVSTAPTARMRGQPSPTTSAGSQKGRADYVAVKVTGFLALALLLSPLFLPQEVKDRIFLPLPSRSMPVRFM